MNLRATLRPVTRPPYLYRGEIALPGTVLNVEVEIRADIDCIVDLTRGRSAVSSAILRRDGAAFTGTIRIDGLLWDARVSVTSDGCVVEVVA